MGISDLIASFLQESLEETDGGVLEVQRNDLAQRFNCVPSQINYVMSTRFSPERGYIVESRRGGNGYIRITRVRVDRQTLLMQVINTLGQPDGPGLRSGHPEQSGPGRRPGGERRPERSWPPSATRPWPQVPAGEPGHRPGGHHEAGADPAGVAGTRAAGKNVSISTHSFQMIGGIDL